MSDIEIKNLPPAPYFARFLEGHETRTLNAEEMQSVEGGQYTTLAAPSDSDTVDHFPHLPSMPLGNLCEHIRKQFPGFPTPAPGGSEVVTQAYPSDSDVVGS